jgi:hypothetical protein
MKQKLQNVKTKLSNNEELCFWGATTILFGGCIYAIVKLVEMDNQKINAAIESGATVIDTPWGTAIINN